MPRWANHSASLCSLLCECWRQSQGCKSPDMCQEATWVGQTSSDPSKRNHCRCLSFTFCFLNLEGTLALCCSAFFLSSRNLCFLKRKLQLYFLLFLPAATAWRARPNTAVKFPGLAVVRLWPEAVWASPNLQATSLSWLWTTAYAEICTGATRVKTAVPFGLQLKAFGSAPS